MLISDEVLREMEEKGKGTHIRSLVPAMPDKVFNATFTKVVTDIANKDGDVRRMARRLSDELEGVGMVTVLKILAKCGMLMNEIEGTDDND